MKYSNSNKPLVCMMTQSRCYNNTSKMVVKGILVHSTAVNNPKLSRYVQPDDDAPNRDELIALLGTNKYNNDLNHATTGKTGFNAFIGKLASGAVSAIQTMPWDFRPWGCGSGKNGSCNDGWIQFEICEDDLTDKLYFQAIYKEACELMAYLCKEFNIDPLGTTTLNGIKVPTILCHQDAHTLGLGSNHADINHWFPKYNKSMDTMRNDIATLLNVAPAKVWFRIRTSWDKPVSQKGAYLSLDAAKLACDVCGKGYYVFDEKGNILYPEVIEEKIITFNIGDVVKLTSDATYSNGKTIPKWVFNSTLYVRKDNGDGNYVVSTQQTGAITGTVNGKYLMLIGDTSISKEEVKTEEPKEETIQAKPEISVSLPEIKQVQPYMISVNTVRLNVRQSPDISAKVIGRVLLTYKDMVVAEYNNKWGLLKDFGGWVDLKYVKKI